NNVTVRAIYPNLAVASADGRRSIVVHHGHYLEGIYRLMTTLKSVAFPARLPPETIWDIEAENFAWIDFFWSTMGRSGAAGVDVGLIYASFQRKTAMHRIADNVAKGISPHLPGPLPLRWLERALARPLLRNLTGRVGDFERSQPLVPLSATARQQLLAYIDGPLRLQFLAEQSQLPEKTVFIFGHTHK